MKLKGRKGGRLKSVLTGAVSAFNLYGSTRSIYDMRARIYGINNQGNFGQQRDRDALSQDWQMIASDMRSSFNKLTLGPECE
jgi:hypothetical protein